VLGQLNADGLSVLIHLPGHLPQHPADLGVGLAGERSVTFVVPAWASRVDLLSREPVHPPEQGHVIHVDATFGEDLLEVPTRKVVPQLPVDCTHDHLGSEPELNESRRSLNGWSRTTVALHPSKHEPSINATVPFTHTKRLRSGQT
jgi:hypothetical protein